MNFRAFLNTLTDRNFTLPVVILYVTAGCNLRCVMCSYRDRLPGELSLEEIERLAVELARLGLRRIVYSGGEPLLRRDFPAICGIFSSYGVGQSLLTNGLLLGKRFSELAPHIDDIIVSLDGPTARIHDSIRGVEAFDRIIENIRSVKDSNAAPAVSMRTVVQRKNFRHLGAMVDLAHSIGVDRVSFLSADVSSDAFHRDLSGPLSDTGEILLTPEETVVFGELMESFIVAYRSDIDRGFVSETPEKLRHLVRYYEAKAGLAPLPRTTCNAPMVSCVITSTGDMLPCYFLPAFGNVRQHDIGEHLNDRSIVKTRQQVRKYTLPRCHECVCTLRVSPFSALGDRF
jgi:Fe-coproporphyrin III synthase